MNTQALGKALSDLYPNAEGNQAARQIKEAGIRPVGIAKAAHIPLSYQTEIAKGIKLAEYVEIKKPLPL